MKPETKKGMVWLLLFGLTFFSGCFDSEDIDRRMIVSPIGIDSAPGGKMRVTFRMPVILPFGSVHPGNQSNSPSYISRSTLTQGIFPALIDIQNRDEHGIFIGQCRAIIFGEAFAQKGVKSVMDFFNRMPTFPPSAFIVIARPSAADLLEINWPEQEMHDQNIRWFFTNQANRIYGTKKWVLFRDIYDPLQDPIVPIVAPSDEFTTMKLLGLAVFRGGRMVGELNSEETILLGMLKNLKNENRLVIPLTGRIPTSFQVVTGKKKLKVLYRNQRPIFKISLTLSAFLAELGGYQAPLNAPSLRQIQRKCGQYVKERLLSLLQKLQTLESDPLDLGNNFRIQQPKYFSAPKWREDYRNAKFQVSVNFFVERLGVLK
jgi:spore germination protein KC